LLVSKTLCVCTIHPGVPRTFFGTVDLRMWWCRLKSGSWEDDENIVYESDDARD
jgi:hypothetical protein